MEETGGVLDLRKLNNILSLVVVLLCLYILLVPFLPNLGFWWKNVSNQQPLLVAENDDSKPNRPAEVIPKENTLVIPRLLMQQQILEGSNTGTLKKGIWHRPNTGMPDQGGNTVIVGHRFTYTEPNGPFYHLDKVREGDKIIMYWQEKKYTYRISKVAVVPATAVEVEKSTDKPMLTLYTCTPLWSAKDRLVVQATLEETAQ